MEPSSSSSFSSSSSSSSDWVTSSSSIRQSVKIPSFLLTYQQNSGGGGGGGGGGDSGSILDNRSIILTDQHPQIPSPQYHHHHSCPLSYFSSSSSSVPSKWIRKVIVYYLTSPCVRLILPMIIGILIGIWIGRRSKSLVIGTTSLWRCLLSKSLFFGDDDNDDDDDDDDEEEENDNKTRRQLKSRDGSSRESGVPLSSLPKHIAVIMDGNRRYGNAKYNDPTRGHHDGSKKLIEFSKWCLAEQIPILTVYAFSTENWNRSTSEINTLMTIFCQYCDELRLEACNRNIRIRFLTTQWSRLSQRVRLKMEQLQEHTTSHCTKLTLNVCFSYGGRDEILSACRSLLDAGETKVDETTFAMRLLTAKTPDPEIVIRTSGEQRLSNFLLWQVAYSELFFWDKMWPEVRKEDLVGVLRRFANGRVRRFGR